jgi:hypothetical protein
MRARGFALLVGADFLVVDFEDLVGFVSRMTGTDQLLVE